MGKYKLKTCQSSSHSNLYVMNQMRTDNTRNLTRLRWKLDKQLFSYRLYTHER